VKPRKTTVYPRFLILSFYAEPRDKLMLLLDILHTAQMPPARASDMPPENDCKQVSPSNFHTVSCIFTLSASFDPYIKGVSYANMVS
jgi:hypothetical protein